MKKMQKVGADRVIVGLDIDAPSRMREVIPVEEHGAERRHQTIGDIARFSELVLGPFRQHRAQYRTRCSHDVHRMRIGGHRFEHALHRGRNPAQTFELALVAAELRNRRQLAVDQQESELFELAAGSYIENVKATIVQVVAGPTDRAQRRVARDDTGQCNRFLWL